MCLENAGGKWASTLRRLLPYADGEGVHAVCPRGKPFPDHCRGKRLLPEQGRVGFEQDLGAPFPVCIADAQILLSDTSQVQYSRIGVRILDGRYRVLSSGHGTTRPLPGGRVAVGTRCLPVRRGSPRSGALFPIAPPAERRPSDREICGGQADHRGRQRRRSSKEPASPARRSSARRFRIRQI